MSGYIGSQPADSFLSISSQQITGNGGATYSLSSSVTSPEDIAVFVNNVRQNPNTYSVSSNNLTLGGTIASSDSCYVVFLGKTLATVNPPSGSVGKNQVSASLINSQTAESSANDSDEILIYDNSATALKKQTRANFLTGVGGTNTPSFLVRNTTNQTVNDSTATQVNFGLEYYDTANGFTSNTYTVPSGQAGKYHLYFNVNGYDSGESLKRIIGFIYKNDSNVLEMVNDFGNKVMYRINVGGSIVLDLSVGDTLKVYATLDTNDDSTSVIVGAGEAQTYFGGYKLIE